METRNRNTGNYMNPFFIAEAACWKLFIALIRVLPRDASLAFGRKVGVFLYLLGIRKQVALANLSLALPELRDTDKIHLLKKLYKNVGEFVVEFIRNDDDYTYNIEIRGKEHIETARQKGRGTIIVLGHMGNWELMGRYFSSIFPYKSYVVAKPMKNPVMESFIRHRREQAGLHVIYRKNALQHIVRVLQANDFVGLLIDQDEGTEGIFPLFFGLPAATTPAVAGLALKYGCTVISVHLVRKEQGYCFVASPPFVPLQTGDRQKDILANTQAYNDYIEKLIRSSPDQWFGWLHKRWKTKPPAHV